MVLGPREVHCGKADARDCPQDGLYPDPRLLAAMFGSEEPVYFPTPLIADAGLALELSKAAYCAEPARLAAAFRTLFERHGVASRPAAPAPQAIEPARAAMSVAVDISILENAQAAGLSRSHFSRRVRATIGLSPRDYRRQQRVMAACTLIESGRDLSYCALEAGFADQSHMTRQMRSMLGVTPGFLRRLRDSRRP